MAAAGESRARTGSAGTGKPPAGGSLWRRRAAYLVFLGLLGLLYFWFGSVEIRIMFFSLLVLPVLSYVLAWFGRRRLRVTQRTAGPAAQRGQSVGLSVILENGGRLPVPYVCLRFAGEHPGLRYSKAPGLYSLPPRSRRQEDFTLTAHYRGSYPVGAAAVFVEDYLRIFRLRCPEPQRPELLVYPAVQPLRLLPQFQTVTGQTAPKPGAVEDYSSVAEIVPYDPSLEFRKIHWKLTARLDELMVRRFDTEDTARAALLLDLSGLGEGETAASRADALAEAAASLLGEWMKNDQPAAFVYGQDRPNLLQRSGQEGLDTFCQLIAGLPCGGSLTAAELLSFYLEQQHTGTAVALLTCRADDALLSTVSRALSSGVQVSIFFLETSHASPDWETALDALEQKGLPVCRFSAKRRLPLALLSQQA
ncbi:MAG: DUF58 domain-containing protein [Clostridiales bacterium]|nr:DUF58 domain-containing protein [Clostridiales bacterium]